MLNKWLWNENLEEIYISVQMRWSSEAGFDEKKKSCNTGKEKQREYSKDMKAFGVGGVEMGKQKQPMCSFAECEFHTMV